MSIITKHTELYGGGITANIPDDFGDVSLIRPVPSHQELYLSSAGLTSILFEINERVTHLSTDHEALLYHFGDTVTEGDSSRVWETSRVDQLPNFADSAPTISLVATVTPPSRLPSTAVHTSNPPLTSTAILLTLIRLVQQSTDLLVTVIVPLHQPPLLSGPKDPHFTIGQNSADSDQAVDFEKGKYGGLVQNGIEIRDEVLHTLAVQDWSLFNGDRSGNSEEE